MDKPSTSTRNETKQQHRYVPPKNVTQISAELKALQDEKTRIQGALRRLRAQKVQNMINHQSDDDDEDYLTSSSSSSAVDRPYLRRQNERYEDGVSSLHSNTSRAHAVSDFEQSHNEDDASFVTGGHYDARGHYCDPNEKDTDEVGTAVAYYQNHRGNSNAPKCKKKDSKAPVVIEWSRALGTYVPESNLAYTSEYLFKRPDSTEISLMVAKDDDILEKSYHSDDLSFSSGDDPNLIAAVTDMPLKIDIAMSQSPGNDSDGDNASAMSGLHSEWESCSISIVKMPGNGDEISCNSSSIHDITEDVALLGAATGPSLLSPTSGESKQKHSKHKLEQQLKEKQQLQRQALPHEVSFSELSFESVNSLGSELDGVSQHKPQEQIRQAQKDLNDGNKEIKDSSRNRKNSSGKKNKKKNKTAKAITEKSENKTKDNKGLAAIAADEDGLSTEDLDALRKREEEMIRRDSGDERPLHHVSRRKKRRSLDAAAGAKMTVAIAASNAKQSSSKEKKQRQKRKQIEVINSTGTKAESSKTASAAKSKQKDRVSRSNKTKD